MANVLKNILILSFILSPLFTMAQQETTPEAEQQALEKALQIHKELLLGADFAKMASQYSDDPGSGKLGGELGYIPQGVLVPEYEEAALKLSEGEFTEPIRTDFGYHIIQLIGIREGEFNTRHILIKPKKVNSRGELE